MKVLLISDIPPSLGGVQLVSRELARELRSRGHDIATLRPDPQGSAPDYAIGTKLFPLDQSSRSSSAASLSGALAAFGPDVVHIISARLPLVSQVNVVVRSVPWLLTVHNVVPQETTIKFLFGRNRTFYAMRNLRYAINVLAFQAGLRRWRFARVLCFSAPVAECVIAYGCRYEKVAVAPLGTRYVSAGRVSCGGGQSLFRDTDYPRIATVAGLDHHKGLHDAVLAMAGLVVANPSLHYVILGSVRDRRYAVYLEQLVRKLGLTSHVSFALEATEAQRNTVLANADLYLQPSHEEGFCLAFLEAAMITGRLVGTSVGGMPSIASNDPLIRIVPRMNPGMLRRNIQSLLRIPVPPEVVKARQELLSNMYSWAKCADSIMSVYEAVLREGKPESRGHQS